MLATPPREIAANVVVFALDHHVRVIHHYLHPPLSAPETYTPNPTRQTLHTPYFTMICTLRCQFPKSYTPNSKPETRNHTSYFTMICTRCYWTPRQHASALRTHPPRAPSPHTLLGVGLGLWVWGLDLIGIRPCGLVYRAYGLELMIGRTGVTCSVSRA